MRVQHDALTVVGCNQTPRGLLRRAEEWTFTPRATGDHGKKDVLNENVAFEPHCALTQLPMSILKSRMETKNNIFPLLPDDLCRSIRKHCSAYFSHQGGLWVARPPQNPL